MDHPSFTFSYSFFYKHQTPVTRYPFLRVQGILVCGHVFSAITRIVQHQKKWRLEFRCIKTSLVPARNFFSNFFQNKSKAFRLSFLDTGMIHHHDRTPHLFARMKFGVTVRTHRMNSSDTCADGKVAHFHSCFYETSMEAEIVVPRSSSLPHFIPFTLYHFNLARSNTHKRDNADMFPQLV